MEINGLNIDSVIVSNVGTNCYIVHKKDSKSCFVVDPGDDGESSSASVGVATQSMLASNAIHVFINVT